VRKTICLWSLETGGSGEYSVDHVAPGIYVRPFAHTDACLTALYGSHRDHYGVEHNLKNHD
jgi:hypothetical protein